VAVEEVATEEEAVEEEAVVEEQHSGDPVGDPVGQRRTRSDQRPTRRPDTLRTKPGDHMLVCWAVAPANIRVHSMWSRDRSLGR